MCKITGELDDNTQEGQPLGVVDVDGRLDPGPAPLSKHNTRVSWEPRNMPFGRSFALVNGASDNNNKKN